jgi:chitodextrinase
MSDETPDDNDAGASCFKCGSTESLERFGNAFICPDCTPESDEPDEDIGAEDGYLNPDEDHNNPIDYDDVTPQERAQHLIEFLKAFKREFGSRPMLMPLKEDSKEPAISGEASLDSPKGRSFLVTPDEAVRLIFEEDYPGFCIYAGKDDHGTEGFAVVDVDEPDEFPYREFPSTGKGMSGSGDGEHLYYHNDGNVERAFAKGEYGGTGEVKAENWYVITPGSIHPSGGVYHITDDSEWATLAGDEIPEEFQPSVKKDMEDYDDLPDPSTSSSEAGGGGRYQNDLGMSLDSIRNRDDKLDALLSSLVPGGYSYPSASEADFAAASKLHFWRYSERDIARIIRDYRTRQKVTDRDDYLAHTIDKAASGEQMEPEENDDGDGDAEPVATLPLERLDRLSHEERVRYAEQRGIEWPDVDEVRDRLCDTIMHSVAEGETVVKASPTGAGKTHTVATEPWDRADSPTDGKPVIHAHRTHEARDQARQMSDDEGVDAYTLKGRKELCPVAAGDFDPGSSANSRSLTIDGVPISEWIDHRCDKQGIPFSVVHKWAKAEVAGTMPCEEGESECPAKGQFEGIPRNDAGEPTHDVIHCTHQFTHVPSLRMHTHIFLDEKPAFGIDIDAERVRRSVNAYLEWCDAPVDNYSDLVFAAQHNCEPEVAGNRVVGGTMLGEYKKCFEEQMDAALSPYPETTDCPRCGGDGKETRGGSEYQQITDYDQHGGAASSDTCPRCDGDGEIQTRAAKPSLSWYRGNRDAHALAPAFTRAIWKADERAGGRKAARIPYHPPRFDDSAHDESGWNRVFVDVVLNDQWEIVDVQSMPDFSLASSVVGLDAHPQPEDPTWQANIHPDMSTDYTLDTEERTLYRRYERGLFTVQVGHGVQPVTSGQWLDEGQGEKFEAIIEHLREQYGEDFKTAITSMAARPTIRNAMEDAGCEDPEMMHFGNEESRNDFEGENIGLVVGSIDPGDNVVMDLLARLDLDAEPVVDVCPICEGAGYVDEDGEEMCETCYGDGEVREHGRTFEGPDADMADAVLQGVREHHVAQSVGRWARNAEDPEDHATVFVVTEAAPTGFIDAQAPGVTWTTNDDQRERLEYVRDSGAGATAKEVADACGCSKQAAWRTLKKAEERGILERTPGAGPYGADLYSPSDAFTPGGDVDLSPGDDEPLHPAYGVSNTFTVAVDALPNCAYNTSREEERCWTHQSTFEWFKKGGPPPG